MLPRPPISTRPVALLPFATLYRSHVGHQVAQGAEADGDALDVVIEVGEEALRLGGVGGTPRTTGRRGRRVGGRVELGRTELVGRGIGSAPTTSHSPSASLIVELAGLFEQDRKSTRLNSSH